MAVNPQKYLKNDNRDSEYQHAFRADFYPAALFFEVAYQPGASRGHPLLLSPSHSATNLTGVFYEFKLFEQLKLLSRGHELALKRNDFAAVFSTSICLQGFSVQVKKHLSPFENAEHIPSGVLFPEDEQSSG